MARKVRAEVAGGLYHVITRGNNRRQIFDSLADRKNRGPGPRFCDSRVSSRKTAILTPKLVSHAQKLASHVRKMASRARKMASHAGKMASHAGKMASHTRKMASHTRKFEARVRKSDTQVQWPRLYPLRVLYQGQGSLEQFIGAFVLMPGAAELVAGVLGYSVKVRLYLFRQRM
jgi:hypothetical protein